MNMKITLVCLEIPYPPVHGARVDMWRRIKTLSNLGVELQLVCWFDNIPKDEEIAEIKKYVRQVCLIPIKRTLKSYFQRIIDVLRYPLEVTSRITRGKELSILLSDVSTFKPSVIWLDGIHGGEVAAKLSKHLNIPLITRSHNIEHLYYHRLLACATGFSKFKRYLSLTNLENYEKKLLKNSALFYDISANDLEFWKEQGFNNGRYLPPLAEFMVDNRSKEACYKLSIDPIYDYDVVFLGNLFSDNNVAGVVWFITQVLPIIQVTLPTVTVLIAGSSPVQKVRQICEEQEGVYLRINPASSIATYNSGRVLINPVATGSGVSIKSVEMLSSGRPIVSTPQGIAGLPEEVRQYFRVAVGAKSFAAEIISSLSNSQQVDIDRKLIESLFGSKIIESVLSDIKSLPQYSLWKNLE